MIEEVSDGAEHPAADGRQALAGRGRLWRGLRRFGVAALVSMAACVLLPELLPKTWTGWGLRLRMASEEAALVQVYYVTGDGWFEEASSVSVKVPATRSGEPRVLFLPLPDEPVLRLRIDPLDREGTFQMAPPVLVGPWQRELEVARFTFERAKGREAIDPVAGGEVDTFRATGSDPWWYYDVRKPPLVPPSGAFLFNRILFAAIGGLFGWALFGLAMRRTVQSTTGDSFSGGDEQVLGRAFMIGVSLFYVLLYVIGRGPAVPTYWFWGLLLPGIAAGILLGTPELPRCLGWRSTLRRVALLPAAHGFAGFVLLFGIYAVLMPSDAVPPKGEILAAVGALLLLVLGFTWLWARPEGLEKVSRGSLMLLVIVGSGFAAWHLIHFYSPEWQIHKRLIDPQRFPLYRPISGSACFAALLLLSLLLPLGGSVARGSALRFVAGLPLVLWTILSQSRGVLLTVLVLLVILALSTRKRDVWLVAGLYLGMAVLFVVTPLPHWIGKRAASTELAEEVGDEAIGGTDAKAEVEVPEGSEAGSVPGREALTKGKRERLRMLKPVRARPRIYQTYFSTALQKPLLGHGFSGEQTLVVPLPDVREELREQRWNPHSVHLSVFYFGGIVGLACHGLLLAGVVVALLQRFRKRGDGLARGLALLVLFAAGCVTFESTLVAGAKEAVILWRPNEYWLFYWLPLCAALGYLIARTMVGLDAAGRESGCPPTDPASS